jgi:hypothetical protein
MEARPEIGISGCRIEPKDGTFDHAAKRSFPTPLDTLVVEDDAFRLHALVKQRAKRIDEHRSAIERCYEDAELSVLHGRSYNSLQAD